MVEQEAEEEEHMPIDHRRKKRRTETTEHLELTFHSRIHDMSQKEIAAISPLILVLLCKWESIQLYALYFRGGVFIAPESGNFSVYFGFTV